MMMARMSRVSSLVDDLIWLHNCLYQALSDATMLLVGLLSAFLLTHEGFVDASVSPGK